MKRSFPNLLARTFLLCAVLALLLSYGIQTAAMLRDPLKRASFDYLAFYTAGRIAQTQGIVHIYDLDLQRQYAQTQFDFPIAEKQFLIYNHLPYLVPIFPSSFKQLEDYASAYTVWILMLSITMLVSITFLTKIIPTRLTTLKTTSIVLSSAAFLPIFTSLANGQDTAYALLGASIFTWGMLMGREAIAGAALSLLTLRPQLALFFIIPLLIWSRKALLSYLITSAALAALSIGMLGWQGTLDYIHLLRISATGDWFGINEAAMYNVLGLLIRLFNSPGGMLTNWLPVSAGIEFFRQVAWGIYLAAMLLIGFFFARKTPGVPLENKFALAVIAALITNPHLHYHDLSLLTIPIFILMRHLANLRMRSLEWTILIPAVISIAMFILFIIPSDALRYISVYLLMAILAYPLLIRNSQI